MARPRKVPEGAAMLEILRDGVFHAEDQRADKGNKVACADDVAALLIERGFARRV